MIITPSKSRTIAAVDLFCGVGGLTKGLSQAGIDVKLGVDIDKACEYPYTANNKSIFLNKSVETLSAKDIVTYLPDKSIKLIAGCAPCQTFSKYNQKATSDDKRWWLLQHFTRLVVKILPQIVTMENVPGLERQDVFKSFIDDLESANYYIQYYIIDCADYGVPQHRHRLVLLASRLGAIRLLAPKEIGANTTTVRDAIGSLPKIQAGEIDKNNPLHQSSSLSELNLQRIRTSKPGGSWRDWEKILISPCHAKNSGRTYGSVYGRMQWDQPAPTITTQFYGFGNGRFGHPEQDRSISLLEGALLQSFPEHYKFFPQGHVIYKKITGRLIGNAVPVKLGKAIGISIRKHVEQFTS